MMTAPSVSRSKLPMLLTVAALALPGAASAAGSDMVVYKTETCGCCVGWVAHAREEGFTVTAHDISQRDLVQLKDEAGLTPDLMSCHTTWVGGYAIEGHVPAEAVKELLEERPGILGLAAPGMPAQSPGMTRGSEYSGFDVLAVRYNDQPTVFKSYR